jgi:hypothetical protein
MVIDPHPGKTKRKKSLPDRDLREVWRDLGGSAMAMLRGAR